MKNAKEILETLDSLSELAKESSDNVVAPRELMEKTHSIIAVLLQKEDAWKSIADDFAQSVTVTQGNGKPRFNVDLERFLSAQYQYETTVNDVQSKV